MEFTIFPEHNQQCAEVQCSKTKFLIDEITFYCSYEFKSEIPSVWWQFFGDDDDDTVGTFDLKVAAFWIGSDRRDDSFSSKLVFYYHIICFFSFLCFVTRSASSWEEV